MKKHVKNTLREIAKAFIARFVVPSVFVFTFLPTSAQSVKQSEPPLQVKYIGLLNEQPLFQVDFQNENGEAYTFAIKDQEGNVLYSEKIKDKKFSKKFKWENTELDTTKLILSLSSEKGQKTQLFEMNTNFRSYQDVVITKL